MSGLTHSTVTVGVTEVEVADGGRDGSEVLIVNRSAATVFLGATGVLTTTGMPMETGDRISLIIPASTKLYAISSFADCDLILLTIER